jgi:hypothetical protein
MRHRPGFTGKYEPNRMIPEAAKLNVIPEKKAEYNASFETTQKIISSRNGYLSHHQLLQNPEVPNRYILPYKNYSFSSRKG